MDIFGVLILLLSISGVFQAEVCRCTSPPNCKDLPNDRTTKIPEITTTSENVTATPVLTTTMALEEYKCCWNDSELQCCKGPQECRPGCEVELKDNSLKCIQNIPTVECYLDQSVQGFVTCSQKKPNVPTSSPTVPNSQTQEQSLQVIKAIVATLLTLFVLVVIGAVIIFFIWMKRNQGEVKGLQKMTIKNDDHKLNDYSKMRAPAANSHTPEDSPIDLADEQDPRYDAQRLPEHGFHNEAVDGRQFEDDEENYIEPRRQFEDDEENYIEPLPSSGKPPKRPPSPQSDPEEQPYADMSGSGHY